MSGDSERRGSAPPSRGGEDVSTAGRRADAARDCREAGVRPACGGEYAVQSCGRETEVDPVRMERFIEAMMPPGPLFLRSLEREALEAGVPIIRPQTQDLLRFFLRMKRPGSILEVGTATGFSALFMKYYAPEGCRIVTIEKDPARAAQARAHFEEAKAHLRETKPYLEETKAHSEGAEAYLQEAKANLEEPKANLKGAEPPFAEEGDITLLEGDALDILPGLGGDGTFDFVFMDAAKGQYIRFLPEVLRLLGRGGLLVTDNILQEGEILSSRFIVTRRDRTIHSRMRSYLRALMEDPGLETLLLSAGDGAAVSVKREGERRALQDQAMERSYESEME